MSTSEAIYFIKDLKEEPAPSEDAGFCHCEARLCVAMQRQVEGERSLYFSR